MFKWSNKNKYLCAEDQIGKKILTVHKWFCIIIRSTLLDTIAIYFLCSA